MLEFLSIVGTVLSALLAFVSVIATYRVSTRVKEIEHRIRTKEGVINTASSEEDEKEGPRTRSERAEDSGDE
ncbi:hypothetical protein HJA89_29610 [Rhizobium bangladeshense]|uniref:hypothetical protein n=1 Tax=Rhizobium bangladeshense TaxID=1138189 RepID=UPI001C830352|nr:hypothetical protein [Rhizobium bangladeshense]MBX4876968.1 hypothetical protein [Rhizobium bangladeshense]